LLTNKVFLNRNLMSLQMPILKLKELRKNILRPMTKNFVKGLQHKGIQRHTVMEIL